MSWLSYLMIGACIIVLANVMWLGLAAWRLNRPGAKRRHAAALMVKSHGSLSLVQADREGANDA